MTREKLWEEKKKTFVVIILHLGALETRAVTQDYQNPRIKQRDFHRRAESFSGQRRADEESEGSNPRPAGLRWPRVTVNAAQHKIVNLLKT